LLILFRNLINSLVMGKKESCHSTIDLKVMLPTLQTGKEHHPRRQAEYSDPPLRSAMMTPRSRLRMVAAY
jgi:hypothetical protein